MDHVSHSIERLVLTSIALIVTVSLLKLLDVLDELLLADGLGLLVKAHIVLSG